MLTTGDKHRITIVIDFGLLSLTRTVKKRECEPAFQGIFPSYLAQTASYINGYRPFRFSEKQTNKQKQPRSR